MNIISIGCVTLLVYLARGNPLPQQNSGRTSSKLHLNPARFLGKRSRSIISSPQLPKIPQTSRLKTLNETRLLRSSKVQDRSNSASHRKTRNGTDAELTRKADSKSGPDSLLDELLIVDYEILNYLNNLTFLDIEDEAKLRKEENKIALNKELRKEKKILGNKIFPTKKEVLSQDRRQNNSKKNKDPKAITARPFRYTTTTNPRIKGTKLNKTKSRVSIPLTIDKTREINLKNDTKSDVQSTWTSQSSISMEVRVESHFEKSLDPSSSSGTTDGNEESLNRGQMTEQQMSNIDTLPSPTSIIPTTTGESSNSTYKSVDRNGGKDSSNDILISSPHIDTDKVPIATESPNQEMPDPSIILTTEGIPFLVDKITVVENRSSNLGLIERNLVPPFITSQLGVHPQGLNPIGIAPFGINPEGIHPLGVSPQGFMSPGPNNTTTASTVPTTFPEPVSELRLNDTKNDTSLTEQVQEERYHVQIKKPDGSINGDYVVLNPNTGSLNGVRYEAAHGADQELIQKALLSFLSLDPRLDPRPSKPEEDHREGRHPLNSRGSEPGTVVQLASS